MEFTVIKDMPTSNNDYTNWMKKKCSEYGHDFMLRIGQGDAFYECKECHQRKSIMEMRRESEIQIEY